MKISSKIFKTGKFLTPEMFRFSIDKYSFLMGFVIIVLLPIIFMVEHDDAYRERYQKRRWEKNHPGEIWPGYTVSKERRDKQSKSLSANPPMLGHKHTEESKKLMSDANLGEKNVRFGVPGYWTGKQLSDEHKKNIGEAVAGEKHPNWQGGISNDYRSSFHPKVAEEDYPIIPPGSRLEKVRIGSLLGDGLYTPRGRFREGHCRAQRELVEVLAKMHEPLFCWRENTRWKALNPLRRVKSARSNFHRKKHGLHVLHYHMSAPVLPCDHSARSLWYPEGKKIVPGEILPKIDAQVLAWWYMGDGSFIKKNNTVHFCTDGFTLEDNMKLCGVLYSFGLNSAKISRDNRIHLGKEDTAIFLALISSYVVPTLRYKLGPGESTFKPYNPYHYNPEPIVTERMLEKTATKM